MSGFIHRNREIQPTKSLWIGCVEFAASSERSFRFGGTVPRTHAHLFILDLFVCFEEVAHFFHEMRIQIGEIGYRIKSRVFNRNRDNFVVAFAAVLHLHECHGTRFQKDARRKRVGGDEHDVERIAVVVKGLRHESVIERIILCRVHDAIKCDDAGFLIDFVFILREFRNLDDDVHFVGRSGGNIMK